MNENELHNLKRQLYKWAKQNLRGKIIKNSKTGNLIEISAQGLDEWYSKSKSKAQIKSISLLEKILEKAAFSHKSENIHSKRKNAPSFEYYECSVEIEEKNFTAIVSVKLIVESVGNRRIYYHHYLDDKNKPSSTLVRQPDGNDAVLLDGSAINISDFEKLSNKKHLPRIVLAAPKSGSGKTLISISMMKAFLLRGKKVAAFKCGPDYIDPMFHKKILKIPSKNLDLFFTDENTTQNLFYDENKSDISIIEGVMGLFDGLGGISEKASTYDLARTLRAPIILVVDAKGMSRSVLAEIAGFLRFDTENLIKGVILNRIPKSVFKNLKPLVESNFKIKALGYFQEIKDFKIESRYLGLKLPDEINDIEENVKKAAEKLEKSVDLDEVWKIAEEATDCHAELVSASTDRFRNEARTATNVRKPDNDTSGKSKNKVRIAVARDEAFCFYYEDNLRLLEKCGAELIFFSPVHDSKLPENVRGIILGGGYPELFAPQLEQNESMRESVKNAVLNGVPSLAECGGFIYLHKTLKTRDGKSYKMAGVIDAETWWTGKLVRFGYVSIYEKNPKFLKDCRVQVRTATNVRKPDNDTNGSFEIKGHEFHYFDSTRNGADLIEEKPVSGKKFEAGFVDENHWWGFAHLYYPSNPEFALNFVEKCRNLKIFLK